MPRGHADLGKLRRILVLIDGNIAPLPIGQRGGARGELQVAHTPDDDRMRMALDDILDEGHTLAAVREKLLAAGAAEFYSAIFAQKDIGRPKPNFCT